MPTYITKHLKNISSGESFIFEVPDEVLARLERQKYLIEAGRAPMLGGSVEKLVESFEFSLFPTFEDVLEIFMEDGYSTKLITKILLDFGADEPFVQELLKDERFVQQVRPWFIGITCDGGRAIRTLKIVYLTALACWENGAINISCRKKLPPTELAHQ